MRNKNLNALLIESNDTMRGIMLSMLQSMKFNSVTSVSNDGNCFDMVVTNKINVIICSWNLSKFNTLNLLRKIRKDIKTAQIPFIIVSTIIEQDKIKEAVVCGVSEYLVPPFNSLIFKNRINKSINAHQIKANNHNEQNQLVHNISTNTASKLSILVVDDVIDNIEIIKEVIHTKYNVKAATNAKAAMKVCLSDSAPDIVLLDIIMPEVDGLTLCKQLKENPMTQNIVILFLTALSEDKDIVKGLSLGAVDYITKPIVPSILLARLQVHSNLILNQRAVQTQIDDLIKQNQIDDDFSLIFQQKIINFITDGNIATQKLINHFDKLSNVCDEVKQPLSDLKSNLVQGDIFLNNLSTLEKLESKKYLSKPTNTLLKKTFTKIIEEVSCIHLEKGLKSVVEMDDDLILNSDHILLKRAFASLYYKAIENSLNQGVITIQAKLINKFALLSVHYECEMPQRMVDYIESFDVNNTVKANYNLWIYLTLQIVNTLNAEFYYHTSKLYGTTFYLKLPLNLPVAS